MKKLNVGDSMTVTLGVNMPTGDRSSPWVRAEVTSSTTRTKDESYKEASERLYSEASKRLDKTLNRLVKYATKE